MKKADLPLDSPVVQEAPLEKEINRLMEKGISLSERKSQIPAIEAVFARHATPERSRRLAALCYTKTLGTPFMPRDLAEIALVETGGHRLSAKAVSSDGALGVWQIMPKRAQSHGYKSIEMTNDEKCAEAAVRELLSKLEMAHGNMEKAKKLYCGTGPDADAYMEKIHTVRAEILKFRDAALDKLAMDESGSRFQ